MTDLFKTSFMCGDAVIVGYLKQDICSNYLCVPPAGLVYEVCCSNSIINRRAKAQLRSYLGRIYVE